MSKRADRELGMHRSISRRDMLHGLGALASAAFVPSTAFADAVLKAERAGHIPYPPAATGIRGNHDGSFEVAHELGRMGRRNWGPVGSSDDDDYDLVVVGAGISGLAAAHFYLKTQPGARVLLLDNHDDFGGHARRNELGGGGSRVIGYGGSQTLAEPSSYPASAKMLLNDLGVDLDKLADSYDQDFFRRHGLATGLHFDRSRWKTHKVVRFGLGDLDYIPLAASDLTPAEAVAQMPISPAARRQFLRLLTTEHDITGVPDAERAEYLYSISYREFLARHLGVDDPDVFAVLQDLTSDFGAGIEAVAAATAMNWIGLPGAAAAGLPQDDWGEAYVHHFPDGNATIARLLVRRMIPQVASGTTADDVVSAAFDYSKLDLAAAPVRLRLNSTAVRVRQLGARGKAGPVEVDYVRDGRAGCARARHCVLACNNAIIPYLCPELPATQREALGSGERAPILYTSVLLNNWQPWKALGIGAVVSSGGYHVNAMLDFPVSFGGQRYAQTPDDPVIVHMEKFPHVNNKGLSPREQRRLGRHELLATNFVTMERNIREQLSGILGGTDFDPARDIAGITVNRWAHGYADPFDELGEPWYGGRESERSPNVIGRQRFGNITIANSDAGAMAMFESAVEQAGRAVGELLQTSVA